MAFSPQTFTVGQKLTAAQMNQVDSNIDAVRACHEGASAPGDLVDGVLWLDTSTDPAVLKQRLDGSWIDLFSITGGSAAPANSSSGGAFGQMAQTNEDATASEWVGPFFGTKNLVTNPGMDIWQRGTSLTGFAVDGVAADRFKWRHSGAGVVTNARTADAPAGGELTYCFKVDVTTADASLAAGDYYGIEHLIEGQFCKRLKWGSTDAREATFSLWVKASSAGTYGVYFQNNARDRSYVATIAISSANTWEEKEITVPGDTTGTWKTGTEVGIRIGLCVGSGTTKQGTAGSWGSSDKRTTSAQQNIMDSTSGDFRTTGWQFEAGPAKTPLDLRPLQHELLLCQRYTWKTFPMDTQPRNWQSGDNVNTHGLGAECARGTPSVGSNSGRCVWNFRPPVEMRATPTIYLYNPGFSSSNQAYDINTGNSFGVTAYMISARHWQVRTTSATGNPAEAAGIIHCKADAELD